VTAGTLGGEQALASSQALLLDTERETGNHGFGIIRSCRRKGKGVPLAEYVFKRDVKQ